MVSARHPVIVAVTGRRLGRDRRGRTRGAAVLAYAATSTRSLRAGGAARRSSTDARDPKALLDTRRRARAHRRPRRRSRALRRGAAPETSTASTPPTTTSSARSREAAIGRGRCRRSRSAAASRCSTSRAAARCTSTSPTIPASPPHGRPGVAGGGRAARGHARRRTRCSPRSWARPTVIASCHHHQAIDRARRRPARRRPRRRRHRRGARARRRGSLLAVQWHPEDTADDDPAQQRLFDASRSTAVPRGGTVIRWRASSCFGTLPLGLRGMTSMISMRSGIFCVIRPTLWQCSRTS